MNSTRLYPDTHEILVNDAARVWVNPAIRHPDRETAISVPLTPNVQAAPDNGLLPFDMDIPFVYNIGSGNIVASALQGANTGGVMGPERMASPTTTSGALDAESTLVERNIDKSRIPCPRLCGAVFSPGVGGLSVFHNGSVKQMWDWYDGRNEASRVAPVPKLVVQDSDVVDSRALSSKPHEQQKHFPRSLQDLHSMTIAAKEAQWGDQDSGVSSDSYEIVGEPFYEDDSDASLDSNEVQLPETTFESDTKTSASLHSNLSDSQRAMHNSGNTMDVSDGNENRTKNASDRFIVASSDLLAPVAWITRAYEKLALHGQSQFLASHWELGPWDGSESLRLDDFKENNRKRPQLLHAEPDGTTRQSLSPPRIAPGKPIAHRG